MEHNQISQIFCLLCNPQIQHLKSFQEGECKHNICQNCCKQIEKYIDKLDQYLTELSDQKKLEQNHGEQKFMLPDKQQICKILYLKFEEEDGTYYFIYNFECPNKKCNDQINQEEIKDLITDKELTPEDITELQNNQQQLEKKNSENQQQSPQNVQTIEQLTLKIEDIQINNQQQQKQNEETNEILQKNEDQEQKQQELIQNSTPITKKSLINISSAKKSEDSDILIDSDQEEQIKLAKNEYQQQNGVNNNNDLHTIREENEEFHGETPNFSKLEDIQHNLSDKKEEQDTFDDNLLSSGVKDEEHMYNLENQSKLRDDTNLLNKIPTQDESKEQNSALEQSKILQNTNQIQQNFSKVKNSDQPLRNSSSTSNNNNNKSSNNNDELSQLEQILRDEQRYQEELKQKYKQPPKINTNISMDISNFNSGNLNTNLTVSSVRNSQNKNFSRSSSNNSNVVNQNNNSNGFNNNNNQQYQQQSQKKSNFGKQSQMCKVHDRPLEIICVEDKVKICTNCALFGQHKGHQVSTEEEILVKLTDKAEQAVIILSKMDSLRKELTEKQINQFLNSNIQEKKNQLEQQIKKKFQSLKQLIQKKEEEAILEIELKLENAEQDIMDMPEITTNQIHLNEVQVWKKKTQKLIHQLTDREENDDLPLEFLDDQVINDGMGHNGLLEKRLKRFKENTTDKIENINIFINQEPVLQSIENIFVQPPPKIQVAQNQQGKNLTPTNINNNQMGQEGFQNGKYIGDQTINISSEDPDIQGDGSFFDTKTDKQDFQNITEQMCNHQNQNINGGNSNLNQYQSVQNNMNQQQQQNFVNNNNVNQRKSKKQHVNDSTSSSQNSFVNNQNNHSNLSNTTPINRKPIQQNQTTQLQNQQQQINKNNKRRQSNINVQQQYDNGQDMHINQLNDMDQYDIEINNTNDTNFQQQYFSQQQQKFQSNNFNTNNPFEQTQRLGKMNPQQNQQFLNNQNQNQSTQNLNLPQNQQHYPNFLTEQGENYSENENGDNSYDINMNLTPKASKNNRNSSFNTRSQNKFSKTQQFNFRNQNSVNQQSMGSILNNSSHNPSRNQSPLSSNNKFSATQRCQLNTSANKQQQQDKPEILTKKKKDMPKIPQKYESHFQQIRKGICETIDLGGAEIGDDNNLKTLKLLRNKITEKGLQAIINSLDQMENLQSINFGQNWLTDRAIDLFEDYLQSQPESKIKSITLSQNKINLRNNKNRITDIKKNYGVILSL
ncbi:hypothetical protein PPERSA_13000 [Pseudocohnilembus persalinus]|uniref:B box-type domain-containing protein n=1 Tax=Pseudocohnilembus persalinus TaxID=266149 RepID=A0A0V0R1W0_PSEPJ|nr:hypothetical protein PPERSA_13000 [Pseudocohnilembus persalinus]|eukprot:KRX08519.1 hypothetical protein PPERSA_13000 [Pseudocohnilembus persalinus]